MNNKNLVDINSRTARKISEMGKKGARKTNKIKKQKKEDEKQTRVATEIIKNIIFSEIKTKRAKELQKYFDSEDSSYLGAITKSVVLKATEKGDVNALFKIVELIGQKPSEKVDVNMKDTAILEIQEYIARKKITSNLD